MNSQSNGKARPLFATGRVLATPAALEALGKAGIEPLVLLARHVFGDWSDMCEEDRQQNRLAVEHGGRIFSSYQIGHDNISKLWVITEADRAATTLLTPGDY